MKSLTLTALAVDLDKPAGWVPKAGELKGGTIPESWDCVDCGVNTAPRFANRVEAEEQMQRCGSITSTVDSKSEIYTVHKAVWQEAGMEDWGGCLCIGCLEKRIGRRLKPKDFIADNPFNGFPGTPRLLSRRGFSPAAAHARTRR
jgi:hypothetical protein